MAITDEQREGESVPPRPLWKRLGWLALIWTTSVATLGVVAFLLRIVMNAAGMVAP